MKESKRKKVTQHDTFGDNITPIKTYYDNNLIHLRILRKATNQSLQNTN